MKGFYWSRVEKKWKQALNLEGKKFGRLKVIQRTEDKRKQWECLCDCGIKKNIPTGDLMRGNAISCGCRKYEVIPLEGKKFGRLMVVQHRGKSKHGHHQWECLCDCGKKTLVTGWRLTQGITRSCGCFKRDIDCKRGGRNKLSRGEAHRNLLYHQYEKTAENKSMPFDFTIDQFQLITKEKCYYCGAAPQERKMSKNTLKVMNGPYIGHGIDRINNELGYTKENCVTCCTQCNYAKRNMDQGSFIEWILRAAKNLSKKSI